MNPRNHRKLLVVDVAALSEPFDWDNLAFHAADSVLPAVTCTAQASFRTATWPAEHGMVANGLFFRDLRRVMFWEQSARLVAGERIWSGLRRRGGTVAMLFWQQSLGEDVDIVLSPAPIHKHHGGMIQDCYSQPDGLYRRLCRKIGRRFKLRQYWGPMATPKVGDWITEATTAVLADELAPDLCLTYLPTLDYDLQRHEADSEKARIARSALENQLRELLTAARREGYETVLFGDYRIGPVERAVFPNRALAQAGLLKTRPVKDMLYPDFWASRAFAVADHQVAHVYVTDPADVDAAREVLSQVPGVDVVMDADAQRAARVAHPNGGELLLLAEPGTWFAYPWWVEPRQRPDYAGHVDIHGGWPPGRIGQDPGKVRGSHGLAGPDNRVVWGATMDLPGPIDSLVDLATAVRNWISE
ncbi:MAG: alkaline phosphatase family protein [Planctomycetota bacterium]|jgi:predicted AlkP superfamily pyrophosphatase or phosphodiesterase